MIPDRKDSIWRKQRERIIGGTFAGFVALLLLMGIVWEWRDPSYGGLSLSDWLGHLAWGEEQYQEQAEEAVQAIGTNGIPLLLKYLAEKDSTPRYLLNSNVAKLFGQQAEQPWRKWSKASAGFKVLAQAGEPAVPELLVMIAASDANHHVPRALGSTRSPQALALFTNMIVMTNASKRITGLTGLGAMREDARFLTGQIMEIARNDKKDSVRAVACCALADVGEGELVVPFLIDRFQIETDRYTRLDIARSLGAFPKQATLAMPVLEAAAQNQDGIVSMGGRIGRYLLTNNIAKLEKAAMKTNLTDNPVTP